MNKSLVVVLLGNFCQNLTYPKDSNAGVTHQNTQIGTKSWQWMVSQSQVENLE
jgi:hypothetical protein